ncbi:MAG: hypothetical protein V1825_03580 [Candidatus Falkowbacteria bacterium]
MGEFVEVERVDNTAFPKLASMIVETDENTKYVLAKNLAFSPGSRIQAENIDIDIEKCRIGKKLEFNMSSGGYFFHKYTSEKTVKKILVKE